MNNYSHQQDQPEWSTVKYDLQKHWAKIPIEDWERTMGDRQQITELIERHYDVESDTIANQLEEIFSKPSDDDDDNRPSSRYRQSDEYSSRV